jgi:hypothetical protein
VNNVSARVNNMTASVNNATARSHDIHAFTHISDARISLSFALQDCFLSLKLIDVEVSVDIHCRRLNFVLISQMEVRHP